MRLFLTNAPDVHERRLTYGPIFFLHRVVVQPAVLDFAVWVDHHDLASPMTGGERLRTPHSW
jgi:hypothetical protein